MGPDSHRILQLFLREIVLTEHVDVLPGNRRAVDTSPKDKAFLLNQYQQILHGCGKYPEAKELGDIVISLCPDYAAYYYNQSLNEEALGNEKAALDNVNKYMSLSERDPENREDTHLAHAIIFYAKHAEIEKAKRPFARLQKAKPLKAAIVQQEDAVRKLLRQDIKPVSSHTAA